MRLLFENWRRFLKEQAPPTAPPAGPAPLKPMDPRDIETPVLGTGRTALRGKTKELEDKPIPEVELTTPIQEENAKVLYGLYLTQERIKDIFGRGWSKFRHDKNLKKHDEQEPYVEQFIDFIVAKNPIFHKNKIVNYLGAGTYGFVVKFDNDHALKIFVGSLKLAASSTKRAFDITGASDIERYKSSQKKAFSGEGSREELHIYETGEIETPYGRNWFYAEMPEVVPLGRHMRRQWAKLAPDLSSVEVEKRLDAEIDWLKRAALKPNKDSESLIRSKIKYLDRETAVNLFKQFKQMLAKDPGAITLMADIRSANVGLSKMDDKLPIIYDM